MTVLGTAGDSTITGAVKAGKAHGKAVVADMIGVADKVQRAKELKALGVRAGWNCTGGRMSRWSPGIRSRSCWKLARKLGFRFRLQAASSTTDRKCRILSRDDFGCGGGHLSVV